MRRIRNAPPVYSTLDISLRDGRSNSKFSHKLIEHGVEPLASAGTGYVYIIRENECFQDVAPLRVEGDI